MSRKGRQPVARPQPTGRLGPFAAALDTRAQLLLNARDLFLEAGPTSFSLREVARRAGVSPAAVYRHFENKETLLAAACTQGFHTFAAYLVRALSAATPLERLRETAEQYRFFAQENPRDYRFIFMSATENPGKSGKAVVSNESQSSTLPKAATFRFLLDRVRECGNDGVLAIERPEETAALVWAHVHGLASLRLSGHLALIVDDGAFPDFFRTSVDQLLRGLAR